MPTETERQQMIDVIRNFPDQLAALINGLTDAQMTTAYLDGEWTVAQNVHHVADSHMNSYIRLKRILTEDNPTLAGYSQDDWATFPDATPADVTDTLNLLRGLHARWATVFERMTEAQQARVGTHTEDGTITAGGLLESYVWHCNAHIDQIRRTLAAGGIER